jgi:hypothetical protein
MYGLFVGGRLEVAVKHRRPMPNGYIWEIYREHEVLPVEESHEQFSSWEEASLDGHKALKNLSAV